MLTHKVKILPHLENLLQLPNAVVLPIITPVLPLRLTHCLCLFRVGFDPLFLLLCVLLLELLELGLELTTFLGLEKNHPFKSADFEFLPLGPHGQE